VLKYEALLRRTGASEVPKSLTNMISSVQDSTLLYEGADCERLRKMPFRILVNEQQQQQQQGKHTTTTKNNRFSYRLEEQQDDRSAIKKEETQQHETSTTHAKAASTGEPTTITSAFSLSSSRPKIQLQSEEDDHHQSKVE
jgi:ABC-type iron transport system FetAB ATPase subunit